MGATAQRLPRWVRYLTYSSVGIVVFVAVVLSSVRMLLPAVSELREPLQRKASELIGAPLQIGRLEGRWVGGAAHIVFRDIRLGASADALYVDNLTVVPNIWSSLLHLELRLSSVAIGGARAEAEESSDGQWQVVGLPPLPKTESTKSWAEWVGILNNLPRIGLQHSQLVLKPFHAHPLALNYLEGSLRSGSQHNLALQGVLHDGQVIRATASFELDSDQWSRSTVQGYVSVPQRDWTEFISPELTATVGLMKLDGGAQVWLSAQDGEFDQTALALNLRTLQWQNPKDPTEPAVHLEKFELNAQGHRDGNVLEAQLDTQPALLQGIELPALNAWLTQTGREQYQFQLEHLDIKPWASLVQGLVPNDAAKKALSQLQPSGQLHNISLAWNTEKEDWWHDLSFSTQLEGVALQAFGGVPAFSGASGVVAGTPTQGEFRLDSENVTLHLAQVFSSTWVYPQAKASLQWKWSEEAFSLTAPTITVTDGDMQVAGDFNLELRRDPIEEDYLDIRIGLRNGNAPDLAVYLPDRLSTFSPALSEWLREGIKAGHVSEGSFQFQGALNPGKGAAAHSISLFFNVDNTQLHFQPGWPDVFQAKGTVLVEDTGTQINISNARFAESELSNVLAKVDFTQPSIALELAGDVHTDIPKALTLLRDTPLKLEPLFRGWGGVGELTGKVALDIPLQAGNAPKGTVSFSSHGGNITIGQANVALRRVVGDFTYDLSAGLSSPGFSARWQGLPLKGHAQALGENGIQRTFINVAGRASVEGLREWQNLPELPMSGQAPYQLAVDIKSTGVTVDVASSLQGIEIDLPEPFGKSADQDRPLHVQLAFTDQADVSIQYGDVAGVLAQYPQGNLAAGRGELIIGPHSPSLPKSGWSIQGYLESFDLARWQSAFSAWSSGSDGKKIALQSTFPLNVNLEVDNFNGGAFITKNLALKTLTLDEGWVTFISSPDIEGSLLIPAEAEPLAIYLKQLRVNGPPVEKAPDDAEPVERKDPMAGIDPRILPSFLVEIEQLWLQKKPVGRMAFWLISQPKGIRLERIELDLRGLYVRGTGFWTPDSTRFNGRLSGKNLAAVMEAWDFEPALSSRRFAVDTDVSWTGSPANLGLKNLSGMVTLDIKRGQFVQVKGGAAHALRLFGILNVDTIMRRLRLDFSDLFGAGLSYDIAKGKLQAIDGNYRTIKPISVKGPAIELMMNGRVSMHSQQVDAYLQVAVPWSHNLPIAAAILGSPVLGGALFVVDRLFGDEISRMASMYYHITGAWNDPKMTRTSRAEM